MIELTLEQHNTISNSFKAEYLKDDIALSKQFNDYDFEFEDEKMINVYLVNCIVGVK